MTSTNAARAAQLGMPWGTAMHKLRKSIIFQLIQKTGDDTCVRCEKVIETVDEMSVEHIKPWLHVDPELFWNLENVAFSHLACNKVDRPNYDGLKMGSFAMRHRTQDRSARGVAWCGVCKSELPLERFTRDRNKYNGVQDLCRECRSKYRSKVA